jgi:hypothetical protein
MPINVIELINSAIVSGDLILTDCTHIEDRNLREYAERLLGATWIIQTELMHFTDFDGFVRAIDRSEGTYAHTPFAMVETNVYLLKKLNQLGKITITIDQLEQIDQIVRNVQLIKSELDRVGNAS